ncbi:kinetochore protein Mis14 like-domain-containing protein [Aspergillus recurvatus]
MDSSHYRKIELQSPADFTFLHGNTVALSRQKLDLHLPPSAAPNNEPDPMRERVRELVDDFITRTFASASASVSINGLDSSSPEFPFPAAFTAPTELETVEYEPFDGKLAARVTSLYAQLESLTTTVAQLRRDAPRRAAREYAKELGRVIEEEEEEYKKFEEEEEEEDDADVEMDDAGAGGNQVQSQAKSEEGAANTNGEEKRQRRGVSKKKKEWDLDIPLGAEQEAGRWRNGEMAEVYEDALRTLLRLQGDPVPGDDDAAVSKSDGVDGNALASTVGKAERAGRAVEFVEKI